VRSIFFFNQCDLPHLGILSSNILATSLLWQVSQKIIASQGFSANTGKTFKYKSF